jgi:hypothetical protein
MSVKRPFGSANGNEDNEIPDAVEPRLGARRRLFSNEDAWYGRTHRLEFGSL